MNIWLDSVAYPDYLYFVGNDCAIFEGKSYVLFMRHDVYHGTILTWLSERARAGVVGVDVVWVY